MTHWKDNENGNMFAEKYHALAYFACNTAP